MDSRLVRKPKCCRRSRGNVAREFCQGTAFLWSVVSLVGDRRATIDRVVLLLVADSLLVRKQKGCLGEAIAWLEATVLRLSLGWKRRY